MDGVRFLLLRWGILWLLFTATSRGDGDEEEHHSDFKIDHRMGKMKIKANPNGADFEFSGGDLDVDIKPAHNFIAPVHNHYHDTYYNVEPQHHVEEEHHEEEMHSGYMPEPHLLMPPEPHMMMAPEPHMVMPEHAEFHGEGEQGPPELPHYRPLMPINIYFHHPRHEGMEDHNFHHDNEPQYHMVEPIGEEAHQLINDNHGYARHFKHHPRHRHHEDPEAKHHIYPSDDAMQDERDTGVRTGNTRQDISDSPHKSIVPSDEAIARVNQDTASKRGRVPATINAKRADKSLQTVLFQSPSANESMLIPSSINESKRLKRSGTTGRDILSKFFQKQTLN